jgi:hypothetical protein
LKSELIIHSIDSALEFLS